ncbi:uncharacterized protein LOC144576981 [Callithrix jacchus]
MPQPRLLARRPGPAAQTAGTYLRLRRPGRPGRAPGRCVSLRPPGKVPTVPSESGRGPEQRRKRRQQQEQPTSGAAHPELLPDPHSPRATPPTSLPPPLATSLRHVTALSRLLQRARNPSAGTSSALGLPGLCLRAAGVI